MFSTNMKSGAILPSEFINYNYAVNQCKQSTIPS